MKRQNQKPSLETKNQTITVKTVIDYLLYLPQKLRETTVKAQKQAKALRLKGDIQKINSYYDVAP